MTRVLARLSGIERRFGSVVALDGAELELRAGEVHGVLGANGAGKSTLLAILGGMQRPDAGSIEVDGTPTTLPSPRDAWRHGIGLVHQHFMLVPALSVLENLALGMRGRSIAAVRAEAGAVMERTGLAVPLAPLVKTLGVGDRQRIEILKALLRDPRILVLDEPTAVLTPGEIEGLFTLLRDLAGEGRAVALVAHKLDEVLGVADRVTVLRDGRTVLTVTPAERSPGDFVRAMVGDGAASASIVHAGLPATGTDATPAAHADPTPVPRTNPASTRPPQQPSPVVARLQGVSVEGERGEVLRDVHVTITGGEVVGIAGVEGNGQHELALVLAGRVEPSRGRVEIPEEVGFIPQDRSTEGLIPDFDLSENVALALQRAPGYSDGPWLRWPDLRSAAEDVRRRFAVAAPSVSTTARALSGGNQQRLIVGRELALGSTLLVAENPTRGLDIGAASFVHEEVQRLASDGVAVVLISTDLDEVLALSSTVYAISRGVLNLVPEEDRSREGVGGHMLRTGDG